MILLFLLCFFYSTNSFFTETPNNISATIGEDVIFRCSAEKSVEPIIYSQWKSNTGSLLGYHQEGVLPGHQGRYSYIKKNSEQLYLKIEHVSLDDDGEYECQMLHPSKGAIRAKAFLNILVPPQEVHLLAYQQNSIVSVKEDIQLNITCVVPNVKPEPQIFWFFNGHQTSNMPQESIMNLNKTFTVFNSLIIKPKRTDDKKVISCGVIQETTNSKILSNVTLDVLFAPSDPIVSTKKQMGVINAGENVTIVCSATSGNPKPELFWYREQKKLPGFSSFNVETNEVKNEYTFISTSNDNMAEYECRANNSHMTSYKKANIFLEVAFQSSDVELFGDSSIRYGSTTTIQCRSLPSNPASQITWKLNGQAVSTVTQKEHKTKSGIISSSNITIHSRDLHDAKHQIVVECFATNIQGTTQRQHIIKLLAPPKLLTISGLKNEAYFEGDMVNITCEALGGNPLAELTWYKGNEKKPLKGRQKFKWIQIAGAKNEVAGTSSFSSLSLRLDRYNNRQKLKCEAFNDAIDEPLIESRHLSVYYLPRRVIIKPEKGHDSFFHSGSTVRLACGAISSNPPAAIRWSFSKKNISLIQSGDVSLNETTKENDYNVESVISIDAKEEDDGSVIYCIASHPNWKRTVNASYSLNILHPPTLLVKGVVNIILSEGESFKENLTIKSNPPVSMWQWKKNGIPFDHTIGRIFARGSVLSGRQLLNTDAGFYMLTATNSVGSTNITVKLSVEHSARITKISTPVIAATGDTIVLECEVEAIPVIPKMINWYKNGNLLLTQRRDYKKNIVQLNATKDNSGEYICVAYNGIGKPAEKNTFVLVNSAPQILHIPRYAKAAGIMGSTIKVRCIAYAVPNVDFIWEKNGQAIKTNNTKYSFLTTQMDHSTYESTLWIRDIVPDDYTKNMNCIARNSFGKDSISIPIVFPTNPEQPFNVTLTNSTTDTISIVWEPGFDGGSEQQFEIKYKKRTDEVINYVNTTLMHLRVSGLTTSSLYIFQLRARNLKGFTSTWTEQLTFSTLDENGMDIAMVKLKERHWVQYIPYLLIVAIILMLAHVIVCCFLCNRTKRRQLREKTELVRATGKGDVRQVQMYGTMITNNEMVHCQSKEIPEMSEDEHSVRTMIEVSPNGYMQPIESIFYENSVIFDSDFQSNKYVNSSNVPNCRTTYATIPYPEPPQSSYLSNCSGSIQQNQINNASQHLSTFINPHSGVRTVPLHFAELDGDLV